MHIFLQTEVPVFLRITLTSLCIYTTCRPASTSGLNCLLQLLLMNLLSLQSLSSSEIISHSWLDPFDSHFGNILGSWLDHFISSRVTFSGDPGPLNVCLALLPHSLLPPTLFSLTVFSYLSFSCCVVCFQSRWGDRVDHRETTVCVCLDLCLCVWWSRWPSRQHQEARLWSVLWLVWLPLPFILP